MLKAAGICIIIFSSSALGFVLSWELEKRIADLKTVKKMIGMLNGEIKYAKAPLSEAFYQIGSRLSEPYSSFLLETAEELNQLNGKSFSEIWTSHIEKTLTDTKLNKEDLEQLKKMGENMGYLDQEMQLATIRLFEEQLEQEMAEANKSFGTKSRVYHCLGVMGGLFLAILMV